MLNSLGNQHQFAMQQTPSRSTPYTAPTLVGTLCILAIMTGALVSACDSGGSNSSGSPDSLVPLQTGNEWTAEVDGGSYRASLEMEVLSDTTVEVTRTSSGWEGERSEKILVARQSDGLLIRGEIITSDDPGSEPYVSSDDPAMLLKYPSEDGDTYQHTDGEGSTYQVNVSQESVSVTAGEYESLKYTFTVPGGGEVLREVWLKPGMGPVRMDTGEEVVELTSTNVGS